MVKTAMPDDLPILLPGRPALRVGQDARGHWLVQDEAGLVEGFFTTRKSAIDFARAESGWLRIGVIMADAPLARRSAPTRS